MKILFETTARHWAWKGADQDRWRGLMVLGADGSTLRVPDSPENRKEFQLPPGRGRSAGYPQVRVAVLMALRNRLWMDFDFADNHTGEGPITWPLVQRVPDHSVTILDGYYGNYGQLQELRSGGKDRHVRNRVCRTMRAGTQPDACVHVGNARCRLRSMEKKPES